MTAALSGHAETKTDSENGSVSQLLTNDYTAQRMSCDQLHAWDLISQKHYFNL
jgi:hypothetical protein